MRLVPARAPQADTPLTILTHEAGHLFLAFASIKNGAALPMLGFQLAHWSFLFDSEASVMEGERIADRGSSTRPEFLTTDITQAYSPLDQYLMGFRAASEVPDVFLVNNPSPNYAAAQHQLSGIGFDGARQNITANDVIAAEGRRTPDSTRGAAALPLRLHPGGGAGHAAFGGGPGATRHVPAAVRDVLRRRGIRPRRGGYHAAAQYGAFALSRERRRGRPHRARDTDGGNSACRRRDGATERPRRLCAGSGQR